MGAGIKKFVTKMSLIRPEIPYSSARRGDCPKNMVGSFGLRAKKSNTVLGGRDKGGKRK